MRCLRPLVAHTYLKFMGVPPTPNYRLMQLSDIYLFLNSSFTKENKLSTLTLCCFIIVAEECCTKITDKKCGAAYHKYILYPSSFSLSTQVCKSHTAYLNHSLWLCKKELILRVVNHNPHNNNVFMTRSNVRKRPWCTHTQEPRYCVI